MIKRYCKGYDNPKEHEPIVFQSLQETADKDGNIILYPKDDITDMEKYGEFNDWSLNAMKEAGINPASFSSPTLNRTRLETAEQVQSIDFSSLDAPAE